MLIKSSKEICRASVLFVFLALPILANADGMSDMQSYLADPAVLTDMSPTARAQLDAFYALRHYHAAWSVTDAASLAKTAMFLDSIAAVIAYHGFVEESYHLDHMRQLLATPTTDPRLIEALITRSLLQLAHDMHGDNIDLGTLYTGWSFHRDPIDIGQQLNNAFDSGTLGAFFDGLAPRVKEYRDLAVALQAYRAIEGAGGWANIATGGTLRLSDTDPRVAQLRARLTAEGYVGASDTNAPAHFDKALSKILTLYQTRNGLLPDGSLGDKTQEALNVPVVARIIQIRANMERWRHMPEAFPPTGYVEVNIPDFSISIIRTGADTYRGSVIVGRPDRPTPFIDSKIVTMLINPSWHVPISIARKDILPKLRHDSHYLEKLGFVIAGRDRDPSGVTVDWAHISPENFRYQLRQVPGDLNSLGQVKFNFANSFDVYMHGTPHQELFDKAERDFSSGCVRLEDPIEVGETMLAATRDGKGAWTQQRIQDEIDSGTTRWVPLSKPLPVAFLYWSVFITQDGIINFRKDIYGYDNILINRMKKAATG